MTTETEVIKVFRALLEGGRHRWEEIPASETSDYWLMPLLATHGKGHFAAYRGVVTGPCSSRALAISELEASLGWLPGEHERHPAVFVAEKVSRSPDATSLREAIATMDKAAASLRDIRARDLLCGVDDLPTEPQDDFLMALAHLEIAERLLRRATRQAREVTQARGVI